jgi:hypothetical protein
VFGTKQNFADGLNVIRAENYAGKSQLVQAIMYALGMEGMQGPSHAVPLAHALTEYLDYKVNGKNATANVIDSMVSLEIENGKGKFLTVQQCRHRSILFLHHLDALQLGIVSIPPSNPRGVESSSSWRRVVCRSGSS